MTRRTEEIRVFAFDLQHTSPKIWLETWFTANEIIRVFTDDLLQMCALCRLEKGLPLTEETS